MLYLLLADLVFIIHLGFILFIIFAGLILSRWPWLIWLHLPAMCWGLMIIIYRWICPLTPLENWLLVKGGASPYTGGFIAEYLRPVIYTEGPDIPLSLAVALVLITILVNGRAYYKVVRKYFSS